MEAFILYVVPLLWIVAAYLIGAIPFGVIVGRMKGVDPRAAGSGNIGATNVFRLLGTGPGLLVLGLDILKGFVPTWLAGVVEVRVPGMELLTDPGQPVTASLPPAVVVLVAIAVILGHSYSVFLRGKGGKSVATTGGALFALDWRVGLIATACMLIALALTWYVSVASTAAAVSLPFGFAAMEWGTERLVPYTLFGTLAMALVVYKHRANYRRLAEGTEPKFGEKKEKAGTT